MKSAKFYIAQNTPIMSPVPVLACALAAKADVIVTGDKDLIVLHPWHGIQILNPADALQWLTSST